MRRVIRTATARLGAVICAGLLLRADMPQVPSGTWASAENITQARSGASAAALADGRILIAGGAGPEGVSSSAELFDVYGSFSPAAPMHVARRGHTSTALADGRVLVAGGIATSGVTGAAEIYDPATDTWSELTAEVYDRDTDTRTSVPAGLTQARSGHTASALPDGKVLIAGGTGASGPLASLELFDPSTNTFTSGGSLSTPREGHAAASLADGRVLIVGGSSLSTPAAPADGQEPPPPVPIVLSSVDIYDPETGSVSAGPDLNTPRTGHSATTLLDGSVLVAGGNDGVGDLASAELYDPKTGAFSAVDSFMVVGRSGHLAFRLPNNNSVLIVGGRSDGTASALADLFIP